jgi:hypothetical protein
MTSVSALNSTRTTSHRQSEANLRRGAGRSQTSSQPSPVTTVSTDASTSRYTDTRPISFPASGPRDHTIAHAAAGPGLRSGSGSAPAAR